MIDILIPSILFVIYLAITLLYNGLNKQRFIILLLLTILIFPKINIISLGNSLTTAGIRLDDLLILCLFCYSLVNNRMSINSKIKKLFLLFLFFMLAGIISILVSVVSGLNSSVFYSFLVIIRYFEYFSLAIICSSLLKNCTVEDKNVIHRLLIYTMLFFMIIGFLQVAGLANYYVSGENQADYFRGKAVATFNGYYEYGCFSAVMTYYFLSKGSRKNYILAGLCLIQVILSASRVSLIAIMVALLFFAIKKGKESNQSKNFGNYIFISFFCVTIVLFYLFLASNLGYLSRFETFNIRESFESLRYNFANRDFARYVQMVKNDIRITTIIDTTHGDLATNIRYFKWSAAIDGFFKYPIFGYGPGITHTMDGNYIKLLGEHGIVGLFLWGYILHIVHKISKNDFITGFILILCVTSIMIDMFEASKIMEFYWACVGVVLIDKKNISTNIMSGENDEKCY